MHTFTLQHLEFNHRSNICLAMFNHLLTCAPCLLLEAESASEGPEEADGRGRGGDRPPGARQEEAAERPGRAAGVQRAAPESAQSSEERHQVEHEAQNTLWGCSPRSFQFLSCDLVPCPPGVRPARPRCSTLWTTMTTTMTSAPTGRRTSAPRPGTSAPPVRTTSCPPSLCEPALRTKLLYMHRCWTKQLENCSSHSKICLNIPRLSSSVRWFETLFANFSTSRHSLSIIWADLSLGVLFCPVETKCTFWFIW